MTCAFTCRRPVLLAVGLMLGVLAGPAQAMAVAGPGGTAEQGRRLVPAEPATTANAPTLDLVSARLEAVDLAAGTVTLGGQRVALHASALRVLGSRGEVLGRQNLRAGQAVRLALEPAAPTSAATATPATPAAPAGPAPARRIVLIYIDG